MAIHPDYPLLRKFFQLWEKESQSTFQIILKYMVSILWITAAVLICFPIVAIGLYYAFMEWYDKIHY